MTTQWPVGAYRIDMVVEGNNKRLAVECDGDRWHPQEKLEEDMTRQAILERLGWRFVRIRGSQFFRNPEQAMEPVFAKLRALGIPLEGMASTPNESQDEEELKKRIIRRADILREEWKASANQSVMALPAPQTSQRYTRQSSISTLPKSASPMNNLLHMPQSSGQTFVDADRSKIGTASQQQQAVNFSKPEQSKDQRELPDEASRSTPGTYDKFAPTQEGLKSLIVYLCSLKITVIDKWTSGGTIWALGGLEHSATMQRLKSKGIHFVYTQRGGEATNYKASWYLQKGN